MPSVSARRQRPESEIQAVVCQHLRSRGVPRLLFWHTPNGGRRDPIEAATFKRIGVRPGVADLFLLHNGQCFSLELKADSNKPTVAQISFAQDFAAAGGTAAVAYGLDHALTILEDWQLLRGSVPGVRQ